MVVNSTDKMMVNLKYWSLYAETRHSMTLKLTWGPCESLTSVVVVYRLADIKTIQYESIAKKK